MKTFESGLVLWRQSGRENIQSTIVPYALEGGHPSSERFPASGNDEERPDYGRWDFEIGSNQCVSWFWSLKDRG